ncbi:MAG TPA: discoidin domain-containing protein, partial [Actinopolymorphaceae bacterium]
MAVSVTMSVPMSVPMSEPAAARPGAPASGSAAAAAVDFFSSLEAEDPAPAWTNTVEEDPNGRTKASGVDGSYAPGIPGNLTDRIRDVTASGENADAGEVKENLVDGDVTTKWLVFEATGWVVFELDEPATVVHYAVTSANDFPERDPRDWRLSGSQDGETWTVLDTRTDESFDERYQTKEYRFTGETAHRYYRLDVTRNHGADIVQLAEVQLSNGDTTPPPPSPMKSFVDDGPTSSPTAKARVGFTGAKALQYAGRHLSKGRAYSYNKVFDVDIAVTPTTELSYLVFPRMTPDDEALRYPATYVSIDLAFDDGTYLSELGAKDQHGALLSPQGQGISKTLYANQWNIKRSHIGQVAAGKRVQRILVAYDNPEGPAAFRGWFDDIRIVGEPEPVMIDGPVDYVSTLRGTHSTGSFSRGNNLPATAVPHGFNFWTPLTDAGSIRWLYEYHRANNADNLPELQGFAASHQPSPWMGDRQTFQVMPSAEDGVPTADRSKRALAFRHANEIARPHYYSVRFENGLTTELAPTDHAAIFRFGFTGDTGTLLFDNVDDRGGLTIDADAGVVTGYSDVLSGLSTGGTRLFVYATFDRPVIASGKPSDADDREPVTGYVRFDTADAKTVTMRIATSLISVEQARRNLELEIGPDESL